MQGSTIQLKHYHFTKLVLEINENYKVGEKDEPEGYLAPNPANLHINVMVNQPASAPENEPFFNAIELKLNYEEDSFPYVFKVELFGVVTCSNSLNEQEEKHEHLFVVNSVSMLYSAIRDQLLTLTARYQYGPMMLPTLDFRGLTKE